jgi:type III secretion system YscJ/HrcJ family lipoprotein
MIILLMTYTTRSCYSITRPPKRGLATVWLLVAVALMTACNQSKSVATVQHENDAIEILAILRENHIKADKVSLGENGSKGWQIVVYDEWFNEDATSRAIRVLNNNGLPRPYDKGMEKAYDDGGLIQSESAQKAQRLKEHKTELERHLRALPGVIRVSVQIVPPEDNSLRIDTYPASASVLLVLQSANTDLTEEKIQKMVASSVLGLNPEKVTVTMAVQPPLPSSPTTTRAGTIRRPALIYALIGGGLVIFTTILLVFFRKLRNGSKNAATVEHEYSGS